MLISTIDNINELYPEESKKLSMLYFEKDAKEGILTYLINNSLMDSKEYQRIWLEYLDSCIKYENYLQEYFETVVQNLIPENYKNKKIFWSLDYIKGELNFYD